MKNVLFRSAWTDVIFEGRNKLYGAYVLRQEQEKHTIAALFIMVGSFAFLFCGFKGVVAAGFFKTIPIVKVMPPNVFEDYKYPDEVYEAMKAKQPVVKTPVRTASADKTFSTEVASTAAATFSDNAPYAPSEDATTTPSGPSGEASGPNSQGTDVGNTPAGNIPYAEGGTEEIGRFAEFMPVFPGNLNSYLALNIKYPSSAIDAGKEGKLLVEVIINEQGKVISAVVVKSLGFGLDEEALRVVKAMPDWEPARMGTRPVKMRMIIPIKFKLGSF